jgi:hypothetical protein
VTLRWDAIDFVRGSDQTAELLQVDYSYITIPSHLAMCVTERGIK